MKSIIRMRGISIPVDCKPRIFVYEIFYGMIGTADSSIGRAEDCSRLGLLSSGRWFDSGSAEFLFESLQIIQIRA
jgi:hypothetical protein